MRTWDEAIKDPEHAFWTQGECKPFIDGFRNGWLDRALGICSIIASTAGGFYTHGYRYGQRAYEAENGR